MRITLAVGLCLCLLSAGPAGARSFVVGDLYLLSNSLPDGSKGIVRVDPLTGATALLTSIPTPAQSTFTYDTYRQRLVYADSRTTGGIVSVDADGTHFDLAPSVTTPRFVAARGDGILYILPSSTTATLRYLDASGVVHDVLDAAGAGPFQLQFTNYLDEIIYDPGTGSLLCLTGTYGGVPPPCVTANRTCAVKIPLNTAGTQVAGPLLFTDVDVSPPSPEIVIGSGLAPAGKVLIVVDTNTNSIEPRMQLLDPATMTMSTFASNGGTYSAAGAGAGTYSSVRGQAVILDYLSNCLRGFSPGESGGGGTVFADSVSGFLNRIIEIRQPTQTGVGEATAPSSHLRLEPVLPNPLTTTALVRFALPTPGLARVTIHDASGRLVRLLSQATSDAGSRTLLWDGRDDRGKRVPQGVYFLRLEAGGESVVRKMTVVR